MGKGRKKVVNIESSVTHSALYACAEKMSGQNQAVTFIDALLTENEKMLIGRRILVAQMLMVGKTRMEICNTLRVSPNTVTLTRKWLEQTMPNYSDVVAESRELAVHNRSAREQKRKQPKEFVDPLSFQGIRKKYPAHFLLFNIAEELLNRLGNK